MDVATLDRSLELTIKRVFAAVWRHKLMFVLTGAAVCASVVVGALALRPVYEGSTLLIGGQVSLEQLPDGTRRAPQTSTALSRIAESEEVVAAAIAKVGLHTLVPDSNANAVSPFDRLRTMVFPSHAEPHRALTPVETFLPRIKAALAVRGELTSDIIRIAFRHNDPVAAANFANAVAQAFVERQIALFSRPGAATFFQRQRERFDDEFKRASADLEKHSVATGTFTVDEQRRLLLKRLNDLGLALSVTRGSIFEKSGERQALAEQLRKLAPVTRSPYVSSLVDHLGGDRSTPGSRAPTLSAADRGVEERAGDPPLLLVKVYQDSMVLLFKVNADLAGFANLQNQQVDEMNKLTAELNRLSQNEQEFTQLKRAVDLASYNLDLYSKRMVEEQINAEVGAAKFSSVKVLQAATVPLRPVFPNYRLVVAAAVVLGLLAATGVALLLDRRRHHRYR